MLELDLALERVLDGVPRMPEERVPLALGLDRVLAEDVVAPLDLPPWHNSAMDGFAVRSADLAAAPARLRVLETIAAGTVPACRLEPGTCSRIMTGAPLPPGADAVVRVEDTAQAGDRVAEILVCARPGENVRRRGSDVSAGATVLRSGRELGPAELGLLASLGIAAVPVAQRPLVALLATGDEVVEPGRPLGPGQIHSSNNSALAAWVARAGGVPLDCGIAPDDPGGLREALRRCLRADLVLTTGGVSVGDFDFVKGAFAELGAEIDFWKVAMKPGKPLAFGRIAGRPLFGLPGNPVSCVVGFLQLGWPLIRRMLGCSRPHLPVIRARLAGALRKKPGRALLARVALRLEGGEVVAQPVRTQSSGAHSSLVDGDGLALLGAGERGREAGRVVRVQVLRWCWAHGAEAGYGW